MERVLEIAASTRVLRERRARALDDEPRGALLGREFVTFRGFAERCAVETDVPVRALLDGPALGELVALCARGRGALGEQLAERPGLAGALAASLRDLRDAGVAPRELPRALADLAATYTEMERVLTRLERDGVFDRVGLFRLAQRGARAYLERRGFTRVAVHGATELVGSVGDLLAAAAEVESVELRFFQPDFASGFVDALDEKWPWAAFVPERTESVDRPALARDGEIPAGVLTVRRARSPRAELEGAARAALELCAAGVPLGDIQIVARSLEPYAPWLEPIFGGYGIPFTSSLRVPDLADPARRVWLDLARAVTRDLERDAVVRVAESLESFTGERLAPAVAALAERIARERAVVRGARDWQVALADAVPGPEREALERALARLGAAVDALVRPPSFSDAARTLCGLGAELFGEASAAGVAEALGAVARLDRVRAAAGEANAPTRDDLARAFDAALREPASTPFGDDAGGVRVLDAVQARAVPCRHLFLLGMVHGAWPRALAEDPFLPDVVRAGLRARLRRPVPLRGSVAEEDRFLLGLLLSQARERVVLSWAESDASGRAQSPSGLLHSLPFVAPGTDVLGGESLAWEEREPTLLRVADALCAAAGDEAELASVAARLPAPGAAMLREGRALVRGTDALQAETGLPYDGEVGDALAPPQQLSPSHLELLGQCPLRAFFARLLRAEPLEPRSPDELEANEAGELVHDALEQLYQSLFAEGALRASTPHGVALDRARALLDPVLDRVEAARRVRVRERHPTAWRAFRDTIKRAILDFVARDLRSLLEHGVVKLEAERGLDARLRAGAGELAVGGTIDRIARLANGEVRVGDYKTSRQFDRPLNRQGIARGTALQIPVYALVVAAREPGALVRGETLTVPLRPERDRDRERDEERWQFAPELERLSARPLAELAGLLRAGLFPISNSRNEQPCRSCPYTVSCRMQHPQSKARIRAYEPAAGYFELSGESA